MARWVTGGSGGSLKGVVEYEDGATKGDSQWKIYQDEKPFLEQAKLDRELQTKKDLGYKKFATVPDIVAIEIKEKHGIDLHAPETMADKDKMAKFMVIMKQEYAYLLSY